MSNRAITKTPAQSVSTVPKLGYSVREATKIIGLGKSTLYEAIKRGELDYYQCGRRKLFSKEHLQSFLKHYEKRHSKTPAPE